MKRNPLTIQSLLLFIYHLSQLLAQREAEIVQLKQKLAEYERTIEKQEKKEDTKEVTTPSGMKPPYEKKNKKKKRKKTGCKKGHKGHRRQKPLQADNEKHWPLNECPHCHLDLSDKKPVEVVSRYTQDIEIVKAKVTENLVERKYCPACDTIVTAPMTDALPRSQLGITTLVLSAWLHFFIGVTIGNILKWFSISHLLTVSKGYLSQAWNRLAQILTPWYEEIKDQAKDSAVLNVDESGWRNNGVTCWLWCFTNKTLALFTIEQSRGSPVLFEILGELFPGVLISDFFGAYNKIKAFAKQRCIVHLLREIKKVSLRNTSAEWVCFARKVKCLFKDAVLLAKDRDTLSKQKYETKKERLYQRLRSLYSAPYEDKDCRRFETLVI